MSDKRKDMRREKSKSIGKLETLWSRKRGKAREGEEARRKEEIWLQNNKAQRSPV